MLQITPKATEHLVRVRRERGFDNTTAPRFVRNGPRVGLTFTPPEATDQVVKESGLAVYLEADVATALEGSIIDARPEDGKVVLVVRQQEQSDRPPSN